MVLEIFEIARFEKFDPGANRAVNQPVGLARTWKIVLEAVQTNSGWLTARFRGERSGSSIQVNNIFVTTNIYNYVISDFRPFPPPASPQVLAGQSDLFGVGNYS